MTGLAQCDEIVRGVPACLTGFDVMDVQDLVLGLAVAVLAGVTVTEQDVLSGVPEPHLFSLLILLTLYVRFFKQMRVELCHLDDCLRHGEDCVYFPDECEVRLHRLFRREPAVGTASVFEPWGTIACLTVSSCPPCLPSGGEEFLYVTS